MHLPSLRTWKVNTSDLLVTSRKESGKVKFRDGQNKSRFFVGPSDGQADIFSYIFNDLYKNIKLKIKKKMKLLFQRIYEFSKTTTHLGSLAIILKSFFFINSRCNLRETKGRFEVVISKLFVFFFRNPLKRSRNIFKIFFRRDTQFLGIIAEHIFVEHYWLISEPPEYFLKETLKKFLNIGERDSGVIFEKCLLR